MARVQTFCTHMIRSQTGKILENSKIITCKLHSIIIREKKMNNLYRRKNTFEVNLHFVVLKGT